MNIHKLIKFKFFLILLLQIFCEISSSASFDYPYSIILANDNILLIQKTGIDIYDKSLNKLYQIFEFSGQEEITEENFSKITIKYNKEYILSIINDKMFIFNNEGKLLYKSESKINNNQIIYSYSLTFIDVKNNTCDYVIGYFDEESYLNLYLYRYDNENNNIALLLNYTEQSKSDDNFELAYEQKLLTCEYMIMYSELMIPNYMNLLVCFYNSNATVGVMVYNVIYDYYIDNVEIIQYLGLLENTLFISTQNIDNSNNIISINSELNDNRNLAIVWWNFKGNNQTNYFIYDLSYMIHLYKTSSLHNYNDIYLYSSKIPNTCINRDYEERINVFPYKDQFAFSCIIENENIQIFLYNKTNLMNNSYIINSFCENNNGLTKLYFNDKKNYLIFSCFKNCSDKKYENDTDCLNEKENEEENKRENEGENEREKEKSRREDEEENKRENERENEEENEEENNEEENKEEKNEEENSEEEDEDEKKRGNIEKKGSKEEEKENKKMFAIIIIIIIIIIVALLITFIIIFTKCCKNNNFERKYQKDKEDEKLMKDILSNLLPK